MTVKELIKELRMYDKRTEVHLCVQDMEGDWVGKKIATVGFENIPGVLFICSDEKDMPKY